MGRWPYRKLRSLEKRISDVEKGITATSEAGEIVQLQQQILTLERKQLMTVKPLVEEEFWKAINRVSRLTDVVDRASTVSFSSQTDENSDEEETPVRDLSDRKSRALKLACFAFTLLFRA